eukprot:424106-Rhodomonas_salina.2
MDAASDDRRSMAYGLPCRIRHLTKHLPQVYRGIEISEDVKRLPTAASKYEKGMSLGVMSKALGLAGLRVGWIASQVPTRVSLVVLCGSEKACACPQHLQLRAQRDPVTHRAPQPRQDPRQKHGNRPPQLRVAPVSSGLSSSCSNLCSCVTDTSVRRMRMAVQDKWSHLFDWTPPKAGCCGFVRYKGDGGSNNNNNVGDFMPMALNLVEQHGVLTLPGIAIVSALAVSYPLTWGRCASRWVLPV